MKKFLWGIPLFLPFAFAFTTSPTTQPKLHPPTERISIPAPPDNSGRGFSYQAVARNTDGQVKAKENIEVQFSLLPGAANAVPTWQERHVATTDEFGVFTLTVGKGLKSGGTLAKFADVDFATAAYWLKVEVLDGGSWHEISTTQLLSVPYAEVAGNAIPAPTGSIMPFAGPKDKIPSGWLLCDGRELKRSDYDALYQIIGTAWGFGDGSTTFRIPDLRGMFLRGVSDGFYDEGSNSRSAMYPGGNTNNNVGSFQTESFKSHSHTGKTGGTEIVEYPYEKHANQYNARGNLAGFEAYTWHSSVPPTNRPLNIDNSGGVETRPDNVYVNYIIKL